MASTIDRRKFIQLGGLASTGFLLGVSGNTFAQKTVTGFSPSGEGFSFTPLVHIDKGGQITLFNPRPEIGQGVFQSVPSLIAEDLEVSLDQVTIKQTGGEKYYGPDQWVGGSSSIRDGYQKLRKTGAAAREMLVTAASQAWNVPVSECYAENGKVFHRPTGKMKTYGELAEAASKLPVPADPKLKDPKDFKLLGRNTPRPDVPLKSNGKAMFGIDCAAPGMVYASIERCPVFGGKLLSVDDVAAKGVKGVLSVVECKRTVGVNTYDGVAVVAENYWAALQGRKALKVTWDFQGKDAFNSKDYDQMLRDKAAAPGVTDKPLGDFDGSFASSPVKLEAFYETPFVSHSPIEPMNCLASWQEGNKLEIWVSTQVPGAVMEDVTRIYKIPEENVKVNVMFNGGGFGRRLINDFVLEAVDLSKKIGRPVKVIWTREDDTMQGPFRPPTFSAMKAGLSNDGRPVAFQHKVISPAINNTMGKNYDGSKWDGDMTEAIGEQAYEIPNMKNAFVYAGTDVPLIWWRAVTSTTLAFAHESFIDEMAVKAKKDPMQYRLDMLTKDSDTKRVLQKLREVSGWDKPLPKGWGRGVAQYAFFAGLCGHVVVVSPKDKGVKIEKVFSVIDMGTVVNPDTVKGQVEGAIAMALSAAIKNGIRFDKGRTIQTNYHNNPVIRIHEMPEIEVHILANGGPLIKGAGEPGLPPFAPALCNAIYAATGTRIRKLPFNINSIS